MQSPTRGSDTTKHHGNENAFASTTKKRKWVAMSQNQGLLQARYFYLIQHIDSLSVLFVTDRLSALHLGF